MVNFCLYYEIDANSNVVCAECDPNYFLTTNNLCKKFVAFNCKTATDELNCATCYDGFELKPKNNRTDCKQVNVVHCSKYSGANCV